MEPVELLLDTVADLRRRTDLRAQDYDIVQAAGLIRRLVIDKNNLAYIVAKQFDVKLRAEWGRLFVAVDALGGPAWVPMRWLDPELYRLRMGSLAWLSQQKVPDPPALEGSLGQFLDAALLHRDGHDVSTRQIVQHYANREGGVHHDPSPPEHPLVADLLAVTPRALDLTMLAISRVVYRSVEPLATLALLSGESHPYGLPDVGTMVIQHTDVSKGGS